MYFTYNFIIFFLFSYSSFRRKSYSIAEKPDNFSDLKDQSLMLFLDDVMLSTCTKGWIFFWWSIPICLHKSFHDFFFHFNRNSLLNVSWKFRGKYIKLKIQEGFETPFGNMEGFSVCLNKYFILDLKEK